MPFTTWIRDLLGIRKDYVETERSVLEIEKLEAEKRERDLITPATLDDVKKYDPSTRLLLQIIELILIIAFLVGLIVMLPRLVNLGGHRSAPPAKHGHR